jgi:hypothetical protein
MPAEAEKHSSNEDSSNSISSSSSSGATSWSKMGVLAMGENPTAWTPSARKNRLSVPAGKISRSTRNPLAAAVSAVAAASTAALPAAVAADDAAEGALVAAAASEAGALPAKSWAPACAAASSKRPKNGFVVRSVSVKKCAWSGAVQGAKDQLNPLGCCSVAGHTRVGNRVTTWKIASKTMERPHN